MALTVNNDFSKASNGDKRPEWHSDRFINFYLPTEEGGSTKIGTTVPKLTDPNHKQPIEALDADPALLKMLQGEFELDYRSSDKKQATISFLQKAQAS